MISFYNTKTRKKEEFLPYEKNHVRLYTCGPTVYDYSHIGNLRSYVFADILKRVLMYNGFQVKHVENITDVGHLVSDRDTGEDKMEKGARREGKLAWEIAEFYTKAFERDCELLNILKPDIFCRATDHIQEQIEFVKTLEKNGYTYVIPDDGVYFDTERFPKYADFARLDIENLKEGARVKKVVGKKHPTDFALWKFSPKDEKRQMEWESPWGRGFPGWHIECSAMSLKYLGNHIDIHTGGIDHIPVHHSNEIAQNFAATKEDVVRFWMHNEHVILEKGEKMAKSKENFIRLSTLVEKGYDPLVYRLFLLMTHYRQQIHFSFTALDAAREAYDRIRQFVVRVNEKSKERTNTRKSETLVKGFHDNFIAAINDDLNTPKALGYLFELITQANKASESQEKFSYDELLQEVLLLDSILGLGFESFLKEEELPSEIVQLIVERQSARDKKDWKLSDKLRASIEELGYVVEDTPTEQRVRKK